MGGCRGREVDVGWVDVGSWHIEGMRQGDSE